MRIEMSPACVFAVLPGSSSCPCFAAALSGSPAWLRGRGTVSHPDGLCGCQGAYQELQAGSLAASLSE